MASGTALRIRRPQGLQFMAPEVADRTRGSKWLSALPTGNADQEFSGKLRKTEDFGNSNLWFPKSCFARRQHVRAGSACPENEEIDRSNVWRSISCAVRRQQVAVGPADRQQVKPGTARVGNADRKFSENLREFADFGRFNLWRLVSCSVRRQQVRAGSACP